MAVVHRVAGPRHLWGRESWVQQFITPFPPLLAPARLRPPSTPLLFSLHSQQPFCGILYSNHTSPQTQRHLPTFLSLLQPCPQPGTPCPAKSCSSMELRSQASLGEASPSREKSKLLSPYSVGARRHAALVVGLLSTHLSPFAAPKGMSFLRARLSDYN